ncbi:MAG: DUF2878 domain-containing protein [Gammaproteobacteria bacterium]
MKKKILNLAIFQAGWIVCVVGGNLYALVYTAIALLIHHRYVLEKKSEWQLIAIVAVVGSLWDILMTHSGMVYYANAGLPGIPIWLICLWVLFATTFMHALSWLSRYLWIAAVFAAVLGPASYWIGSELSDAYFGTPILTSLVVMAAGWSTLFPAGIYLSQRYYR